MISPIVGSLLAEMVPTWAISRWSLVGFESFFSSSVIAATALVDAALEAHRVVPGGDHLGALGEDGARQHGGGGGAVAGDVGGLGRDLLHHLRAHVLELVLELDLLGDGDAVLGDGRRPERLLEHDVAALGPEGHGDGVGEQIDALEDPVAGLLAEFDDLCSHVWSPFLGSRLLAFEHAEDVVLAHDEELLAVELDLGAGVLAEQDAVAGLDVQRISLPSSLTLPLPTATTLPSWGFSLAVSGMMMPPLVAPLPQSA